LAIAFIVGQVDVFFSFLEGLVQAFTQSKNTPSPAAALASKLYLLKTSKCLSVQKNQHV